MKTEFEESDIQAIAKAMLPELVKALRPMIQKEEKDDSFFTVPVLAEYLKVSSKWIYERVQFKEIPHYKFGGNLLYSSLYTIFSLILPEGGEGRSRFRGYGLSSQEVKKFYFLF